MWQRFWMAIARKQKELWWSICFILLLFLLFNFLSFYLFWWFWWWSWLQPHEQGRQFFLFSFCFFVGILYFLSYFFYVCILFYFCCFSWWWWSWLHPHEQGRLAKRGTSKTSSTLLFPHKPPFKLYFCTFLLCFNCIFNVSFNCIFLYFSCFHLFIVL